MPGLLNTFRQRASWPMALLFLITVTGFLLRWWTAHLDPFINLWDERFHAIVARNMMDSPFVPQLHINPLIPTNYANWPDSAIWLHKPPLFLWQMAISMKIFGVSEYSAR